jgi:hypothetical protein
MTDTTKTNTTNRIIHTLDAQRDDLLARVTEHLQQHVPPIGVAAAAADKDERHHGNMERTAQRFHEIVKAGATIDWSLVGFEFEWAGRKLSSMGATWEHQQVLIDSYFAEALRLHPWSADEQAALQQIAARLREVAQAAYNDPSLAGG